MLQQGRAFFCSWSGGKDACLALYKAVQQGGKPLGLLSMLDETGEKTKSHNLPLNLIRRQAKSLGITLEVRSASWETYENEYISALKALKAKGITAGVFGDIDIQGHYEWVENVCARTGIQAVRPLWHKPRSTLVEEFIQAGFKAKIIVVKKDVMDTKFLGRMLDLATYQELKLAGIDPAGEEGEFHTVVLDGPLFSRPIKLQGENLYERNGYAFLQIEDRGHI